MRWWTSLVAGACLAILSTAEAADIRFAPVANSSGLSHNSVYSMIQDRRGFLWIGTADGLNRFDGHEFVVYRSEPLGEGTLSSPVIRALHEDRDGTIWVGTENGLYRLDVSTGRFDDYPLHAGPGSDAKNVFAIFESTGGSLWIGTDRGAFECLRDVNRFECVSSGVDVGTAGPYDVFSFSEHPDGSIWALASRDGATILETVSPSLSSRFIISDRWGVVGGFAIDRKGRLWIKPPRPIEIDPGVAVLEPPDDVAREPQSLQVLEAKDGAVWIALAGGFFRSAPDGTTLFSEIVPDGNWLENIGRFLLEDRAGAMWIGTFAGVRRYDPLAKPFEVWRHDRADENSLSVSAISSIWEDSEGILWLGTFGGGLNRIDRRSGAVQRFRHSAADSTSVPHDVIWSILGGDERTLWLGTEDGLARFDQATGRARRVNLPYPPEAGDIRRIGALARDDENRLWIAGPMGLYRLDLLSGQARFFLPPHEGGLLETSIESILPASDGRVWVGTGAAGLREFDEATERFVLHPLTTPDARQLTSEGLWSLHEDASGMIWIGSGVGLSRFDPSSMTFRHYLPRDGLPGSIVYSIEEDGDGRLWMGTNRGLVRFTPQAGPGKRFRIYDTSDGIAGVEFNRNAAFRGASGALSFGGLDGLTLFRPSEIRDDPRRPPIALTSIEITNDEGTRTIEPVDIDELELTYDDDPFGFEFVALSFSDPERNRYRYQLEGFDRDWIDSGAMRFARYTNVPPGDYVFHVIGSNQDGVWNEQGASLPVTILPPFWMTLWFRLLVLAALATLLWLLHRVRVSRLLELERLRLRIANDLHDDLSSDLSGIAVSAELLRRKDELTSEDQEQLKVVRDRAVEMAGAMRDMAWGINPEHDTLGSIVRRMRSTAEAVLGDIEQRFEVHDVPLDEVIGMESRRNLMMIFKELVHNIASHAEAGLATISLRRDGANLLLTVEDDGDGFDMLKDFDGDGLRNMRRRAVEMDGTILIDSAIGEGTRVELRFPFREPNKWRGFGIFRLFRK